MNTAKIARLLHEIEEIITDSINMEQPVQWADGAKALAALDTIASEVAKGSRTGFRILLPKLPEEEEK